MIDVAISFTTTNREKEAKKIARELVEHNRDRDAYDHGDCLGETLHEHVDERLGLVLLL